MATGTFENIRVNMPVKVAALLDIKICEKFGEHSKAVVVAILEEEENETVLDALTMDTNIQIVQLGDTSKILFSGVPTQVAIHHVGGEYRITIQLHSYSILLDLKKKNRSFQNKDNTYTVLFRNLVKEYGGSVKDFVSQGSLQKQPFIQWEETDWEFMKRLASRFHAPVYSNIDGKVPQVYIGICKSNQYTENSSIYQIEKDMKQYLLYKENEEDTMERNYLSYQVTTPLCYGLGDGVFLKEQVFVVAEKRSEMIQGRLLYTYVFLPEKGTKVKKHYQEILSGVVIEGTVIAREEDKVKLHLSIDSEQNETDAYWFSMSTSYSAEGSTGWYAIPEKGQSVLLYIPGRDEGNAYVIKTKRLDGEMNGKTQDPKTKYFGTKEGNEMIMSPSQVTFHVLQNNTIVSLSNGGGISISSPEAIAINAGEFMGCDCKKISVTSKEKIVLGTKQTSIVVDNVTHIIG